MKSWKTIIVDDEPLARLELKRLLEPFRHLEIIGEADSVKDARDKIASLQPDLLFLDIDMGTQSGFDLLEETDIDFKTIFVTAYNEYAIRAFEINALDYLLKPVHPDRLRKTILRLDNPSQPENGAKLAPDDKILISNQRRSRFIAVTSISYIEANGDYTNICTSDGFKGIAHVPVKKWMERLPESHFIQIHRSYLVNMNHITEIDKGASGHRHVILSGLQQELPISRNFLKNLKARFQVDH